MVAGPLGCWLALRSIGTVIGESTMALSQTGDAAGDLGLALDVAADALGEAKLVLADGAGEVAGMSGAAADLVEVVTVQVPAALDSVGRALPALEDSARVLDRTMRALSVVGVDYDAEVPLDQSIDRIRRDLAVIPGTLREQAGPMVETMSGLSATASDLLVLADQVAETETAVREAATEAMAVETTIRTLEEKVTGGGAGLRWAALLMALVFVATGWGLITANLVQPPGSQVDSLPS